jgi:hypothetical protein
MTIEESIVGAAVSTVAKALLSDAPKSPSKKKAQDLRDRLDVLEAERLVLTVELRNALMREAKKLLPQAIRQARGTPASGHGRKARRGRPGSPALLRLIARLAMRDVRIDVRK